MSKQFRLYLLPSDATRLVEEIRNRFGARTFSESSPTREPVELPWPVQEQPAWFQRGASVRCYLAPLRARIDLNYYPKADRWTIQPSSEAIQFAGCEFDGETLLIGRMYFQNDDLKEGRIVLKQPEFIAWANQVFRYSKAALKRDPELDAYIGPDALSWRQNGGRFALSIGVSGQPVCE